MNKKNQGRKERRAKRKKELTEEKKRSHTPLAYILILTQTLNFRAKPLHRVVVEEALGLVEAPSRIAFVTRVLEGMIHLEPRPRLDAVVAGVRDDRRVGAVY